MKQRELRVVVTQTGGDVRRRGVIVPDSMTEDDWRMWWHGIDNACREVSDAQHLRYENRVKAGQKPGQ